MNRHSVPNATYGLPGRPINGGSRPRFYHFDDDVTRLVKWHPSPHGGKACYNELVASRRHVTKTRSLHAHRYGFHVWFTSVDSGNCQLGPHDVSLPRHLADKLSAGKLQPALEHLQNISETDVRNCFHDVPDEWAITDDERDAAVRRTLTTQRQVEQILRAGNPAVFAR